MPCGDSTHRVPIPLQAQLPQLKERASLMLRLPDPLVCSMNMLLTTDAPGRLCSGARTTGCAFHSDLPAPSSEQGPADWQHGALARSAEIV